MSAFQSMPVFGVFLTVVAYAAGVAVHQFSGKKTWVHPVMLGVLIIIFVLSVGNIPFADFWNGGSVLSFLMGPIVVALAIPLLDNLPLIRQQAIPILVSLLVGGLVTLSSAVGFAYVLGLSKATQLTLTTKSVTSAIGMEIANAIGGIAPLSALVILVTGIFGGVLGPWLLNLGRIHDPGARGMAYGLCAHAIGTQQAFEEGAETGAIAALSMSFMGVLCALIIPLLLG